MPSIQDELRKKLDVVIEEQQDLNSSDRTLANDMKTRFSEARNLTDLEVVNIYKLWIMSEDAHKPESLIEWFIDKLPKTEELDEPITEIAQVEAVKIEEEIEKDPSLDLDDLSYRERMTFLLEIVARRRTEELHEEIIQSIANVYKQKYINDGDIVQQLGEYHRMRDFLLSLLKALGVTPKITVIPDIISNVGTKTLHFNRRSEVYSMTEFEHGIRSAMVYVEGLKNKANKLESLTTDFTHLGEKLIQATKQLAEAKESAIKQDAELLRLKSQKYPSLFLENNKPIIVVQYPVVSTKDGSVQRWYLTVVQNEKPNEKGIFALRSFRRTKVMNEAMRFDSVEEATLLLKRMKKNVDKLHPDSKIKLRSIQASEIITFYGMITQFST